MVPDIHGKYKHLGLSLAALPAFTANPTKLRLAQRTAVQSQ
jgi:hypothetical protein